MASSEVTKGLMTEVAGQSIASAISAMGLSTIGNMSALTTTDKTSLVGAINEVKSGLINVARIPTTSPESAITSVAGGTNYTYTATSDGFLAVHAPLEQDAREFNVFIRDINAAKYGVSIYAKVVAYHGDVLGGLFVKAGRAYYIDNVGSNSVDLYLDT